MLRLRLTRAAQRPGVVPRMDPSMETRFESRRRSKLATRPAARETPATVDRSRNPLLEHELQPLAPQRSSRRTPSRSCGSPLPANRSCTMEPHSSRRIGVGETHPACRVNDCANGWRSQPSAVACRSVTTSRPAFIYPAPGQRTLATKFPGGHDAQPCRLGGRGTPRDAGDPLLSTRRTESGPRPLA